MFCSGHCSFTIGCAQNVQAHMVSQKEGEGNASIREAQWGHGIWLATPQKFCHRAPKGRGQAAEGRLTSLLRS